MKELYRQLPRYMQNKNPKLFEGIESMITEFYLVLKVCQDERFLTFLMSALNFSQFLL